MHTCTYKKVYVCMYVSYAYKTSSDCMYVCMYVLLSEDCKYVFGFNYVRIRMYCMCVVCLKGDRVGPVSGAADHDKVQDREYPRSLRTQGRPGQAEDGAHREILIHSPTIVGTMIIVRVLLGLVIIFTAE